MLTITPIVVPSPATIVKKCAIPGCTAMFLEGHGFVVSVDDLYLALRGANANKDHLLSRSEILSQEMCQSCSGKYKEAAKKSGVDKYTFKTQNTLDLMVRAAKREVQLREKRDREKAWAERMARQNRPRVHHTRVGEDMLDTIATSAKWAERLESRKKHKRLPAAERRRLAETRGSRPFASIKPEKKGKKKDQGGGKKGRK